MYSLESFRDIKVCYYNEDYTDMHPSITAWLDDMKKQYGESIGRITGVYNLKSSTDLIGSTFFDYDIMSLN